MSAAGTVRYSEFGARLRAPAITGLMSRALQDSSVLSLAAGFTDTTTLPAKEIGRTVQRLVQESSTPEFLQYGTNQGRPRLRELVAAHTAALDGVETPAVSPDQTIVGNGSQQLLFLATQVLCDPGDIVLVERPSYFVYLEALRALGVRPVELAAAEDGILDLAGIRRQLTDLVQRGDAKQVKALYLMGYFANPSGWSRTEDEKRGLAEILREVGLIVPVIEDAAYRDLWFDEPWPCPSVLTMSAWQGFPRAYFGTLTKPYASGLKVGYAHVTDFGWLERMGWSKGNQDFGTANFNQSIFESILGRDGLNHHLAELRPRYRAKMHCVDQALEAAGLRAAGWSWRRPAGGLCMWLRGPEGLDTSVSSPLWEAAMQGKVLYVPGGLCLCDERPTSCVRLSFGVLNEVDLREAAQRFSQAASQVSVREPSSP